MSDKSRSYYKFVGVLTEDADVVVIPDGEQWRIQSWKGAANGWGDTHVCVIWDYEGSTEEILALTYLTEHSVIERVLVGDGVKKLAIVLRNDSLNPERIGAQFEAVVIANA